MICPNCGREIPESSRFCKYCGTDIFAEREYAAEEYAPAQEKPKASRLILPITVCAVCCVCICVMGGLLIFSAKGGDKKDADSAPEAKVSVVTTTAASTAPQTTAAETEPTEAPQSEPEPEPEDTEKYHEKVEPQGISHDAYNRRFTDLAANETTAMRIGPGADYDAAKYYSDSSTAQQDILIPDNIALNVFAEQTDDSGEEWSYVYFDGEFGWCVSSALSSTPDAVTTSAVKAPDYGGEYQYTVTTLVDRLILKKRPDKENGGGNSMFEMPKGEILEVYGYKKDDPETGWLYVKYDDGLTERFGWIRAFNSDTKKKYVE